MEKVKLRNIKITRLEGGPDKTLEYTSFKDARIALRFKDHSYPKLGYDKHRFLITWEDGESYEGRLDLHHPENEFYDPKEIDISQHVADFLEYGIDMGNREPRSAFGQQLQAMVKIKNNYQLQD